MLAIYGTSGLMYRGPVEDLRKVVPALQAPGVRPMQVALDRLTPIALPGEPEAGTEPAPHTTTQALQAYTEAQKPGGDRRPLRLVADVMSRQAIVTRPETTLAQAWQQLLAAGVGQMPVVNPEGGLVGLLTRSDLMQRTQPGPDGAAPVSAGAVAAAMVSPVPSVTPEVDLRRLALVLLETGLPGLPVVDDAGLVQGFVSRTDILTAVVHDPPLDLWAG